MTPDSELFKVDVKRQGGVAFPLELSEYISKDARHDLSVALFWSLEDVVRKERNNLRNQGEPVPRKLNTSRKMASILDVDLRTVQRWRNGGVQSCNINADKLVKALISYDSKKAESILKEDLEEHRKSFEKLFKKRQPPVAFPSTRVRELVRVVS